MLVVCASSTDSDFATTGDVMLSLFGSTTTGSVATTQEINYLGSLVRRASAWAESYLGYPLGVQTYQETVAGKGAQHLILSRTPIRAVLRVFDATDTGNATALCSTDYRIEDPEAGFLSRDRGFAWSQIERTGAGDFNLGLIGYHQPGMEMRPWLVEYIAGYVGLGKLSTDSAHYTTGALSGTSTETTLPEDIRHAVAMRAVEMQSNPVGVTSRRVGDLAVQYGSAGIAGALSESERILLPYRRVF